MPWVAKDRQSLILWLLRSDGPATTSELSDRLKAWAERDERPWTDYEVHTRSQVVGVNGEGKPYGPGYQHFYSQLKTMERKLLVVVDGKREVGGAHIWRATRRAERRAAIAEIRAKCEPTDEDRALAEEVGRKFGADVMLDMDEEPRSTSVGYWFHGWVVVPTARGDIEKGVPYSGRGNSWDQALRELLGPSRD
jgi:hypothetical protein